jgi:hypothetical protein
VKLEQLSILTPDDMVKVIDYLTKDRLHRETFMTVKYAVLVELLKEVVGHELGSSSVSTAFAYYLSLLDFFVPIILLLAYYVSLLQDNV